MSRSRQLTWRGSAACLLAVLASNGPAAAQVTAQGPANPAIWRADAVPSTSPPAAPGIEIPAVRPGSSAASTAAIPVISRIVVDAGQTLFEGTAEPGTLLDLSDSRVPVGVAPVDNTGRWRLVVDRPFAPGEHRFSTSSRDPARARHVAGSEVVVEFPKAALGAAVVLHRVAAGAEEKATAPRAGEVRLPADVGNEKYGDVLTSPEWRRIAQAQLPKAGASSPTTPPAAKDDGTAAPTVNWLDRASRDYQDLIVRRLADPRPVSPQATPQESVASGQQKTPVRTLPAASTPTPAGSGEAAAPTASYLDRVSDWMARAGRDYNNHIVKELTVRDPVVAAPQGEARPAVRPVDRRDEEEALRRADAERRLAEQKAADERRLAEQKAAEARRLAERKAEEQRLAEAVRPQPVAPVPATQPPAPAVDDKAAAEALRLEEERRMAEARRLDEERRAREARLEAERRQAEARRLEDDKRRLAEQAKSEEALRAQEEAQRRAREQLERQTAEERRRQQEALATKEAQRRADEQRQAEQQRLLDEQRQAELRRQAELQRQADQQRQAELRQAELQRQDEARRRAEQERLAALRNAERARVQESITPVPSGPDWQRLGYRSEEDYRRAQAEAARAPKDAGEQRLRTPGPRTALVVPPPAAAPVRDRWHGYGSDEAYRRALHDASRAPKERDDLRTAPPRGGREAAERRARELLREEAQRVEQLRRERERRGAERQRAEDLRIAARAPKVIEEGSATRGDVTSDRRQRASLGGPVAPTPPRRSEDRRISVCPAAGRRISLPGTYVVRGGDTLWDIAERFYGDGEMYQNIIRANKGKLPDPDLIEPCQKLRLPRGAR